MNPSLCLLDGDPANDRSMFWQPVDPPSWRIVPFSKRLMTLVSKSPNWGYYLPNCINGLYMVATNYQLGWSSKHSVWIKHDQCRDSRCSKRWTYGRRMWCEIYGHRRFFSLWCALVFLHLSVHGPFWRDFFQPFFCWTQHPGIPKTNYIWLFFSSKDQRLS